MHPAPRGIADLAQDPVAGEEVGVGDHYPRLRRADRLQVLLLDVVAVLMVVAADEQHPRIATARALFGTDRLRIAALPPAAVLQGAGEVGNDETMDVGHDRPFDLDGVVLLGLRSEEHTSELQSRENL